MDEKWVEVEGSDSLEARVYGPGKGVTLRHACNDLRTLFIGEEDIEPLAMYLLPTSAAKMGEDEQPSMQEWEAFIPYEEHERIVTRVNADSDAEARRAVIAKLNNCYPDSFLLKQWLKLGCCVRSLESGITTATKATQPTDPTAKYWLAITGAIQDLTYWTRGLTNEIPAPIADALEILEEAIQ